MRKLRAITLAGISLFCLAYAMASFARQEEESKDCKQQFPHALTVSLDDEKFYVNGLLDGELKLWPGEKLPGNMMMIARKQNSHHGCYAIVTPGVLSALPANYVQLTDEAMILPSDDESEDIIAMRQHISKPERF